MKSLYESDFYLWTLEQAQLLRHKNLNQLDWENLIEEVENLGRLIEYLLKIEYVSLPECKNKWRAETLAFKKNAKKKLSPSMIPKLKNDFEEIYRDAAIRVEVEYEVKLPEICPYTLEELLA